MSGAVETLDDLPEETRVARRSRRPKSAADRDLKIGVLLHDVARLRRNTFDQIMKPMGLTRSQWWVIANLSREDGMMQTELADFLDIGKVTLGGIIDRLESGGWIKRQTDAADRRAKRIYLTESAQGLLHEMRSNEKVLNGIVFKGFSNEERNMLSDFLRRMKMNLIADASAG